MREFRTPILGLAESLGCPPNQIQARVDACVMACSQAGLTLEQVVDACKMALAECDRFPPPSKLVGFVKTISRAIPTTVSRWDGDRPSYLNGFETMSPARRKWHADRDRALWEVKMLNAGKPVVPSYFALEGGLSLALERYGMDPWGNETDFMHPPEFVEPPEDRRHRSEIEAESAQRYRERMDDYLEAMARRREESLAPPPPAA